MTEPDPAGRQHERRSREQRGRSAETVARLWLRLRGYRILRHRMRTPVGEIDIIAERKGVIAIVEVKARAGHAEAMTALTPGQRRRIERAAAWFVAQTPAAGTRAIRFDLMVIRPLRRPVHIEGAWTPTVRGL